MLMEHATFRRDFGESRLELKSIVHGNVKCYDISQDITEIDFLSNLIGKRE